MSRFAVLESAIFEEWARNQGSTLETRFRFTPSDCFETFPFPNSIDLLHDLGQQYFSYRQPIQLTRQEGLTQIYNRFQNQAEIGADVVKLLEQHVAMDQAVAAAYGWQDLNLSHGFHETKQGIRFTLSEAARREVLDRLLALNHPRRTDEQAAAALAAATSTAPARRRRKPKDSGNSSQITMDM